MINKFITLSLLVLAIHCVHGSPQFHDEAADTKVLSEVWEAMDKNKGDDIIVIPHHHKEELGGLKEGEEGPKSHEEGPKAPEEGPSKPDVIPDIPEIPAEESKDKTLVQKLVYKLNRLGDIMGRAVDQLRKDDSDIQILKSGQNRTGTALSVFDIIAAVILGVLVVAVLLFGTMKGFAKVKAWRAGREGARLVDQEAPNMDGTGYQSGYNP